MDFDVQRIGDVGVVLIPGDTLEASNLKEFNGDIAPILEENAKIVLDMSQIRFIDSMGCGSFLSLLKILKNKGGGLKLCCITDPVDSLFKLMGFNQLFGIYKTREEAVDAFKSND